MYVCICSICMYVCICSICMYVCVGRGCAYTLVILAKFLGNKMSFGPNAIVNECVLDQMTFDKM